MIGHASDAENAYIAGLEAELAISPSWSRVMDLAVLYVEPGHEQQKTVAIMNASLALRPDDGRARIWLAFCAIHWSMDRASLERAVELLEPAVSVVGPHTGAAAILMAEALDDLSRLDEERRFELLAL